MHLDTSIVPTKTCKDCRHWREQPREFRGSATDIASPAVGICKAVPPTPILTNLTKNGLEIQAFNASTPATFEACGMFQESLALVNVNGHV